MIISSVQRRRRHLAEVVIDQQQYLLDIETVAEAGLRAGAEISDSALQTLIYKSELTRAKNKALWLVSMREYSAGELRQKLRGGYDETAIDEAVELLVRGGVVDDERFARCFIQDAINLKGLSRRVIELKLRQRGVDRELARTLLDEYETDELPVIKQLIAARYADYTQGDRQRARMFAALQRRGYGYADINRAINELEDE